MKTIINNASAIVVAALMTGCLQETESEFEKIAQRDDAIMEEYISSNNIDATKTQLGYYYRKDVEVEEGSQFTNNNVIGVYYEIKTVEGHLIDSHLDEEEAPILFKYTDNGLWPSAVGYAAGLAREGEEMTLYVPSYLAYNTYSYQQLISSGANLVVKVKYAKRYTQQELEQLEDEMIQAYITENELEGFEKKDSGIYVRVVEEGEGEPSKNGNNVTFSFELYQIGISEALAESEVNKSPSMSLGSQNNMDFLNEGLLNLPQGTTVEILAPSFTAYGETIQIIPQEIRFDLVKKGELQQITAPYTPIRFNAEIVDVK
ncbi:MAG: hypothetical protein WD426_12315 [Anditalea sp.]